MPAPLHRDRDDQAAVVTADFGGVRADGSTRSPQFSNLAVKYARHCVDPINPLDPPGISISPSYPCMGYWGCMPCHVHPHDLARTHILKPEEQAHSP